MRRSSKAICLWIPRVSTAPPVAMAIPMEAITSTTFNLLYVYSYFNGSYSEPFGNSLCILKTTFQLNSSMSAVSPAVLITGRPMPVLCSSRSLRRSQAKLEVGQSQLACSRSWLPTLHAGSRPWCSTGASHPRRCVQMVTPSTTQCCTRRHPASLKCSFWVIWRTSM